MSLRDALRRATGDAELQVAAPSTCNTQLHAPYGATDDATALQQQGAKPCDTLGERATTDATVVQLSLRNRATEGMELHVASAMACNTQLSALTAPRIASALVAAINRTCDLRGDDEGNRAGLIAECSALPLDQQAEMLAHFRAEAARWARATGQVPTP